MRRVLTVVLVLGMIASGYYANAKEPEPPPAPNSETTYLQLMDLSRWDGLSDQQQQLYVMAFLKTLSFFLYGVSPRNKEIAQSFSDLTACAEHEPAKRWTIMTDWLFGDMKATVASQCFKNSGYLCQKYKGKGDMKWNPVQLISANEWSTLSPEDKEIYALAYVETEDVMAHRARDNANVQLLESCVKNGGKERFIDTAKTISVESEYPLPWSISRAFGKACK